MGNENFSHLDPDGQAHMVDISEKQDSKRTAKARATISMAKETIVALQQGDLPKGDVFAVDFQDFRYVSFGRYHAIAAHAHATTQ